MAKIENFLWPSSSQRGQDSGNFSFYFDLFCPHSVKNHEHNLKLLLNFAWFFNMPSFDTLDSYSERIKTYRVLGNCGPKVTAFFSQNMKIMDFLTPLGAPQMWSI